MLLAPQNRACTEGDHFDPIAFFIRVLKATTMLLQLLVCTLQLSNSA